MELPLSECVPADTFFVALTQDSPPAQRMRVLIHPLETIENGAAQTAPALPLLLLSLAASVVE